MSFSEIKKMASTISETWLLLLSSNQRKEYISDIVEVLGVPAGFIMHFRYRKKWVQSLLWDDLPLKQRYSGVPEKLNLKVLIIYLYQDQDALWQYSYPMRFATVNKCYKTGDDESDVAHFYLLMEDYCAVKTQELLSEITELRSGKKTCLAATHKKLPKEVVENSKDTDESAFYQLVSSIKLDHFVTIEDSKQYYPVFHFISGFREASSNQLQKFGQSYNLTEGKEYILETSIRFVDNKLPGTNSNITLACYEKRFENKQELVAPVTTYYDEFTWRLVPSSIVDDRKTTVTLATNIEIMSKDLSKQDESVLNVTIDLPVTIRPDSTLKIIGTVSDTSLVVATATIAYISLSKTLQPTATLPEWPGYVVGIIYIIGVVTKIILRWRGR
jgi:hypothetical protein